ncbi:hypothetical protein ACGFI4_04080 [Micromonospora carbonacea]|uniref:hypothetical protein n=1 Tax=Micromonospora carbonacea TaxID=47853 RepID=UPI0037132EFA
MRLRQPGGPPYPEPDVSLRVLVLLAVAGLLGVLAWRVPATVNPMLIAVATYAVLDRLTDHKPGSR